MIGTLAALAALLLGAGAIGGSIGGVVSRNASYDKAAGKYGSSDAAYKNAVSSKLDYDGLTEEDRKFLRDYYTGDTLDQYLTGDAGSDWWQALTHPQLWGKHADWDQAQKDWDEYQRALSELGERPPEVDYEGLATAANDTIDRENEGILALYDQMLGRSNNLFQQELDASNASFNDYANQIQANNAMATNAIAGSTRYEMDRARRNAIVRGASAAQQLTAKINAQLGLQNRAAQQQLETSNQLASALLQQRQAASQLRGDYVSSLNADASRRADLMSGTAERKSNLRNSYYNEAEARHDAETDQWKDRMSGYLGDNPYKEIYNRNQSRGSDRKSTYGLGERRSPWQTY